jgi:hypothetical protein
LTKIPIGFGLLCLAIGCSSGPGAVDFKDPLTGPISQTLQIPFDKFALTPEGLLRTDSTSGTTNGVDRPIVKTRSAGYLSRDFRFDVTVTIPPDHADIAYVGFGAARSNSLVDNEPTSAFVLRIHNLPSMPHYDIDAVVSVPNASGTIFHNHFAYSEKIGEYRRGESMAFRIERIGDRVTMSVVGLADSARTLSLATYPGLFSESEAHLFFTNSAEGTTFSNLSVTRP